MKTKIASFISFIGHPLLTISVFAVIAFFTYENFQKALLHSIFILCAIFIPLTIKMYVSSKNGTYTNFDVSNQTQRQSWYVYAIVVLFIVTIILFVKEQPRTLRLSVLFSLLLLTVSKLLNYFIKSSLHISFNIFLSFLIMPMNSFAGLFFLLFTVFIAWARFTLNRHSIKELFAGSLIGFTVGIFSLFII